MDESSYNHEWQPINRAPQDGTNVLLYGRPTTASALEIVVGCFEEGDTWGWCDNRGHDFYPTHWMPLPKFPDP